MIGTSRTGFRCWLRAAVRPAWRWYWRYHCQPVPLGVFLRLLLRTLAHGSRPVVIVRTQALGDVLCCLPLAREARKTFPERPLIFLTRSAYVKLVTMAEVADDVWPVTWSARFPRWFCLASYRLLVPKTSDERGAGGGERHLTQEFASSCGMTLTERQFQLRLPGELLSQVRSKYGLVRPEMSRRLVVGLGAGRTWPVREWPLENWLQLVGRIAREYPVHFLQFGVSLGDLQFEQMCIPEAQLVANCPAVEEVAALVAQCDLVIAIESGLLHLAGAVGTPVVGLFGAVSPALRLPLRSPATGVHSDVPCRFCHHRTPAGHWRTGCPHNIRCMKELEVAQVYAAACPYLHAALEKRTSNRATRTSTNRAEL